jgi:hypothetical protein
MVGGAAESLQVRARRRSQPAWQAQPACPALAGGFGAAGQGKAAPLAAGEACCCFGRLPGMHRSSSSSHANHHLTTASAAAAAAAT